MPQTPQFEDVLNELRRIGTPEARVAVVVGLVLVVIVAASLSQNGGPGPLMLLLPVLGIVGFLVARAWVTARTYSVTVEPAPPALAIGDTFTWGVRIWARRDVVLSTATVTLRCQEHTIVGSGNRTSHYRRPIYEQHYRIAAQRLHPGQEYEARPQMTIPANAIPSFTTSNHRIEWSVEVQAPTEGLCASVRQKASITVTPRVAQAGHADDPHVPVQWLATAPIVEGRTGRITLGGVAGSSGEALKGISVVREGIMASLEVTHGVASDIGPILAAGTTRELKLVVEAQEAVRCRSLRVWIGCHLAGKGHPERIGLFGEESVWEGELAPGRPVEAPIRLAVPATGPVTYVGQYARFSWEVRVRLDMPLWRDRVVELPFIVTPQAVQG